MSTATAHDVETSLMRALTPTEAAYVAPLLERAQARIRERVPDLATRISTSDRYRATVVDITAEAVARVLRNPSGMTQETEGNYSYTKNFRVASGLLDILDTDWDRLGVTSVIGSVSPVADGYAVRRYGPYRMGAFERFRRDHPGPDEVAL